MPGTAAAIDHRRELLSAFARFVWRRFRDDRCFESAGALSFTTVFALVPLSAAVLGIMAAFPVFETWSRQLTDYLFENYVPAAAKAVQAYLTEFASNASQLTVVGGVVLLASALLMMAGIEDTLNRIWRAPGHRRRAARFVAYWTVLTLGPILLAASLGLSSYLFTLPLIDRAERQFGLSQHLLRLLPFLTTWSALTLAFVVVPNAAVRVRNAAIGALFATVLFELAKQAFGRYVASSDTYERLYGALSVLPLFLVWIYWSWVSVLLGASLAASLSAFRYVPLALRATPGLEFAALLRVHARVRAAAAAGTPLSRSALAATEPGLSDDKLDSFLSELSALQLLQRSETGQWLPLRDPAAVTVRELFEGGAYRWPTAAELARLKAGPIVMPALLPWFEQGSLGLAPGLDQPLAVLSQIPATSIAPDP